MKKLTTTKYFFGIFIASLLMINISAEAKHICPTSGDITLLCHTTSNGLSLTGCYKKGLTYMCTTDIKSCNDVKTFNKTININWTLPNYDAARMRFTCPNQGASHQAEKISMNVAKWHEMAERVHRTGNICPVASLPVLCHQQEKGVSLIGCYDSGLRYICSKHIKTCKKVDDHSVSKAHWADARYDEQNLVFQCGHGSGHGKERRTLSDDAWHRAVNKAH